MLEYQKLQILPWSLATGPPAAGNSDKSETLIRRLILDPHARGPLGFICRAPQVGPRWLRVFIPLRQILEVREIEDESLLFTLHKRKGLLPLGKWSYWDVRDAEGSIIGTLECRKHRELSGWVASTLARDVLGQLVLALERWPDGMDVPVRVLQPGAPASLTELAMVCQREEGVRIEFAESLQGEPFAKMLVLAAVVVASNED